MRKSSWQGFNQGLQAKLLIPILAVSIVIISMLGFYSYYKAETIIQSIFAKQVSEAFQNIESQVKSRQEAVSVANFKL